MNQQLPDQATIKTATRLALRAPSVHNSQPWRWRVSAESLHLYADPQFHLAHADPDARDLYLSCGIALHHIPANEASFPSSPTAEERTATLT